MPTYEYECEKCGYKFELFQSMTDKPVEQCPQCEGKVKRLFGSGGGIIFKGSGFYTTDYRSKEYKKKAQEETKKFQKSNSKENGSKKEKDSNSDE